MVSEALLIWVLAVEIAALASTILILFGYGFRVWWYGRWSQPSIARARDRLAEALQRPLRAGRVPPCVWRLPWRLRIRLFADVSPSLSGAQRKRLTELAHKMNLIVPLEGRCRSRLWWRRLHAARLLTLLGGGETVVPQLLTDPHPLVRAQAAEWATGHATPAVIDALLNLLADRVRLCRSTTQDALSRMGEAVVQPLAKYLSTHSGHDVEAALEVAVHLADQRFLASGLTRCRDESPRVRELSATLLGALGGETTVEVLTELLADPAARVRAAAARALGKLGHWPAAPTVAPFLRDPAWIVRRETGLALRDFGAPGILFLRRYLTDSDRFAADMARQVLDLPDTIEVAGLP